MKEEERVHELHVGGRMTASIINFLSCTTRRGVHELTRIKMKITDNKIRGNPRNPWTKKLGALK